MRIPETVFDVFACLILVLVCFTGLMFVSDSFYDLVIKIFTWRK